MMASGRKLVRADYADPRSVRAARFFLGKVLCVQAPDGYAEGVMIETEAYGGRRDAASHAFGNRRTARTEIMFAPGGVAYVYLCYGMHRLFNIVTGPVDSAQAVLVRAVKITAGHELVRKRRVGVAEKDWASGPGRVCAALGIEMHHNRHDLLGETIWIEDRGIVPPARQVKRTPRIGVDYAGVWALKPWRFVWSP
ncbi:MAG: DNA-3-methyladenine glycosylase [Methylacidiphilales bacterium]|nr:DNA-3-methyladenine glycosylase [Candidatus Methylacidiphilales bacterium]